MNRLTRYILSFGAILCTFVALPAQNISIQGKLDRAEIKTGEQAAIDLRIRTSDLERTKFYLKEQANQSEAYTVIEFGALDTIDLDGKLKEITARLIITSFDSTLITIPPIVAENPEGQAETEPMALKVIQPEVDAQHPNSFKDIKAPWEVSLSLWDWLELLLRSWVFWAFIALCLTAYIVYRLLTRSKKKPIAATPSMPMLSLWERTEQRLLALEIAKPEEQEEFKAYYTELVSTIKDYLDEAKGWDTLEMTTSELSNKLNEAQFPREQVATLTAILQEADLSKFAKAMPTLGSAIEALHQARGFLLSIEQSRVNAVAPKAQSQDIAHKTE